MKNYKMILQWSFLLLWLIFKETTWPWIRLLDSAHFCNLHVTCEWVLFYWNHGNLIIFVFLIISLSIESAWLKYISHVLFCCFVIFIYGKVLHRDQLHIYLLWNHLELVPFINLGTLAIMGQWKGFSGGT